MAKKKDDVDRLTQARYAKVTYERMKESIKFFDDMLAFHIKMADSEIKKLEKAESEALNSDITD